MPLLADVIRSTEPAQYRNFDPVYLFSSIDCQRLPRCHLSISFWVFLLVVFHLWVSNIADVIFSPNWCSSFCATCPAHCLFSCTSLFLLYLSPLFSILLSRSWILSLLVDTSITSLSSRTSLKLQHASSLDVVPIKSQCLLLHRCFSW